MTTRLLQKLHHLLLIFFVSILLVNYSVAQEDLECGLAGRWAEGPCEAVAVSGDVVFYSNGSYVEIVDISDPSNPLELSRILTESPIFNLIVRNSELFICNEADGLIIVDISDPIDPQEISVFDIPGYDPIIFLHNNFIFYGGDDSYGMRVIDISDLSTPSIVNTVDIDRIVNMDVSDQLLWCARGWDGISALDISDPENPVEIFHREDDYYYDVALKNDFLFTAHGDSVKIFDINNLQDPLLVNAILSPSSWYMTTFKIEDDIAFIAESSRLKIYDIHDPLTPMLLGEYTNSGHGKINEIIYSQELIHIAKSADGLELIDVSDLQNPTITGFRKTHDFVNGVAAKGEIAIVSRVSEGIQIIDVSNLNEPTLINAYEFGYTRSVSISGNLAFIASDYSDLSILDISDPYNTIILSNLDLDENPRKIDIMDNLVFLTQYDEGFIIIDVADPNIPVEIGSLKSTDRTEDISTFGDLACIAAWDEGLRIIDISDLENPVEIGYLADIGKSSAVAIVENLVLIGNIHGRVKMVDISDPVNPTEISEHNLGRWIKEIKVINDLAYVSIGFGGLIVLNISDPQNPKEIEEYNTWGYVHGAAIDGDYVYLADEDAGMTVIRCDVISKNQNIQSATSDKPISANPNPFENVTQIKTEFSLVEINDVSIFDLGGKLIYQFSETDRSDLIWNGSDNNGQTVDPGIYLCRIGTTNSEHTIKIVKL